MQQQLELYTQDKFEYLILNTQQISCIFDFQAPPNLTFLLVLAIFQYLHD